MSKPTAADYALVDAHWYMRTRRQVQLHERAARAVAACRSEYEAKLADERKHADEETKADAEGWRNGQAQVQRDFDLLYADHQALKARLALAEAVCEWERHNRLLGDSQVNPHLSAWRAAK